MIFVSKELFHRAAAGRPAPSLPALRANALPLSLIYSFLTHLHFRKTRNIHIDPTKQLYQHRILKLETSRNSGLTSFCKVHKDFIIVILKLSITHNFLFSGYCHISSHLLLKPYWVSFRISFE